MGTKGRVRWLRATEEHLLLPAVIIGSEPDRFPPYGTKRRIRNNLALDDDIDVEVGEEGVQYHACGNMHHGRNVGRRDTLLVTTPRQTIDSQCPGDRGVSSAEGEGEHGNERRREKAEETERARSASDPPSPSTQQQAPATSLSSMAPLPLLVFDTETFFTLGELSLPFRAVSPSGSVERNL